MSADTVEPKLVSSLSLVIPLFNEQESLEPLWREIQQIGAQEHYSLEVVFVDDGSTDGSWEVIRKLASEDSRIKGIKFRTNFGKAAALSAGFATARGELVVTMDADLQDDPHEIPNFLKTLRQGYDLVSGWKKIRFDPWHKVFPSRVFNFLVSSATGVHLHDHNCGMKIYRREVTGEISLYGEMHRFIPSLAVMRGFRVGEMVLHHRPRKFGRSKYGAKRFIKGFLDLITVTFRKRFGQRPMHPLGFIAGFSISVGVVVCLLGQPGWAWFLWLVGFQFFLSGLLAELQLGQKSERLETYAVSDRIGS
ncbi:glycosyltransferase family 2 protein [Telmatocola sphagniphila]|uniref:Glycosyltransferase family 2 protein n=1 Tax=Telmatocola sphagniphila TaxID=1123043 RepID=A0A8E6B6E3_9BACT|nr:glycosyltransferase family 2 protein [Telmatocola sphagniphila]QVL32016.1 glycosyltransferase family 2 protein [Telmatocola sphagniphila]